MPLQKIRISAKLIATCYILSPAYGFILKLYAGHPKHSKHSSQIDSHGWSSNRYWKTKQLSPKRLSTGILVYTLAAAMCEEVHLYGFWPFGWDPSTGRELPYHYYDRKGTKFTTKWQESHQLPAEFKQLYKMHAEGLTKLSLSHCI